MVYVKSAPGNVKKLKNGRFALAPVFACAFCDHTSDPVKEAEAFVALPEPASPPVPPASPAKRPLTVQYTNVDGRVRFLMADHSATVAILSLFQAHGADEDDTLGIRFMTDTGRVDFRFDADELEEVRKWLAATPPLPPTPRAGKCGKTVTYVCTRDAHDTGPCAMAIVP